MPGAERLAAKGLNWLGVAYAAEALASAASSALDPLTPIFYLAASIVAVKASLVASGSLGRLDPLAGAASLAMLAASAIQAVLSILSPGAAVEALTLFLAASAAYCYASWRRMRGFRGAGDGAALAAVGSLVGAVAPEPPGIIVGLALYAAGLHGVLKSLASRPGEN